MSLLVLVPKINLAIFPSEVGLLGALHVSD